MVKHGMAAAMEGKGDELSSLPMSPVLEPCHGLAWDGIWYT